MGYPFFSTSPLLGYLLGEGGWGSGWAESVAALLGAYCCCWRGGAQLPESVWFSWVLAISFDSVQPIPLINDNCPEQNYMLNIWR
jgi:hypothetical protein